MRFDRMPATKQMLFRAVGTSPDHLSLPLCGAKHDQKLTGVRVAIMATSKTLPSLRMHRLRRQHATVLCMLHHLGRERRDSSFKHAAPNGRAAVCPLSVVFLGV
mmetsp:Transcript_146256/g.207374  ORF Transcript_146256/g.207374 Transcript_146256/m.207374 type:complete len:104 (+) Transcript_146256:35-346(+)